LARGRFTLFKATNNSIMSEAQYIPFEDLPYLSNKDIAYATQDERLRPFYQYAPNLASFKQAIIDKQKQPIDRETLVAALKNQYKTLSQNKKVNNNIEALLDEHTFTVTTAHQPSLFGGPLYFIYKIISTIKLARILNSNYKNNKFVPVFVLGAEDHDFAEINHLNVYGKRVEWDNGGRGGAVGAMPTDGLETALQTLAEILGESEQARNLLEKLRTFFLKKDTYAISMQIFINELFSEYGLIVLNPSDAALKRLFIPIMKSELLEQPSNALVTATQDRLQTLGFKPQAFTREINLFFTGEGFRERIVLEGNTYKVLNQNLSFTKDGILELLEKSPELFSPNVVLRPLYQESILPNLAYVGGGGEIAYWLERKSQFEYFSINFPMLVRRDSFLVVDSNSSAKMEKLHLSINGLCQSTDALIKQYVLDNAEANTSLEAERQTLNKLFEEITQRAKNIEETLEKTVMAEGAKAVSSLNTLEQKMLRAEKRRHETAVAQIRNLKEKLFPNDGLQERHDNFLPYYLRQGPAFFDELLGISDPFDARLKVLSSD
jgi:bacillithiol biosynthesis cysteine-adding enzyme BshC